MKAPHLPQDRSLSPAYITQMERLLGSQEAAAYFQTLGELPQSGLRVNTLKLSPGEFCKLSGWALEPVPWCEAGFRLRDETAAGKHAYHAAGLYYLQEPSAMAVAGLMDPQPGERMLDLSAAPGGKATHLASLMQGSGWLLANEIHPRRAWELAENLERWGARNACVINETPERLAAHFGPVFDRVLVDAPCSGEGMFRKSAVSRRDWSPEYVAGCAMRQSDILEQAAKLVRPGGRLVYATCTLNPQENEQVVARFLEAGGFDLVEPERAPGFAPGRPEWLEEPALHPELARAVRLWPHHVPGEGHFVAVMERTCPPPPSLKGGGESYPTSSRGQQARVTKWDGLFEEFWQGALDMELPAAERLQLVGSYLYWTPPEALDLGGLRAIHPGWWLGTLKKGRFEPSHALAMALRAAEARRRLDLQADEAASAAYLRGESLQSPGPDGWLLVCVEGFPLGWGKRVAGVVKNYYPKGLRRFG